MERFDHRVRGLVAFVGLLGEGSIDQLHHARGQRQPRNAFGQRRRRGRDLVGQDLHRAVALAYTAPAEGDEAGFDRSAIVELTEDGPVWLAGEDGPGLWAFEPTWSADGQTLWYVHVDDAVVPTVDDPAMMLRAVEPETGRVLREIAWATEPTVSPDGEHMAYVQLGLGTWVRNLVLATADGEPIRTLVHAADVYDLGLPHWSADGSTLYVAILEDPEADDQSPRSAELQALPDTASHGVHLSPADWFAVDLDAEGLEPTSALATILYDAAPAGDGVTLFTATREGIDAVDITDGSSTRLLDNRAIRSLAWRRSD